MLLLNDHVFKIISPSWITGKLSDFAGLFFFPFIVAAGLSGLLARFNFKTHVLGQFSFGLVAIWFFFLKISPNINSLTTQLWSFVIGLPVQFILDWTDILGLTAMVPAWKLWKQQHQAAFSKLAYVGLVVGAYATLATSPIAWTVTNVTDLVYSADGVIYAADRSTFGQEFYPIAKSLDGGLTWEEDFERDSLPNLHEKKYPVQICNSQSETLNHHCYRVTSNHQLERYWNESWVKVFSTDVSVRAYDIIVFTREESNYMLVAIGEAGVMRRDLPDGNWEIIRVINAGSR
jgi:hypothetical protein